MAELPCVKTGVSRWAGRVLSMLVQLIRAYLAFP